MITLASYHCEMEEHCFLDNSSIYRQDVTLTVCHELLESGYKVSDLVNLSSAFGLADG